MGSARVSLLFLALAGMAVAAAALALRGGWRSEPRMPEARSVVDEAIVHIPKAGLVVWAVLGDAEDAVPTVDALHRGGVTAVALQGAAPALLQAIERAHAAFSRRVLVGAGVRTAEEAREAARAGAEFVLLTGVDAEAVRACQDARALTIPSGFSATEIGYAWRLGTGLVGIFPAGPAGPGYVRHVIRVVPDARVVAVGGIGPENAADFLRAGAVAVVALEESPAGEARDYDAMTRHARALADAVERARAHPSRPAPPPRPVEGPDIR
jgi:2-dehydro-3-deoxyphosphogluconate aldolase/(4S)-4-hydroxy-2-oxoglutarate aldolase